MSICTAIVQDKPKVGIHSQQSILTISFKYCDNTVTGYALMRTLMKDRAPCTTSRDLDFNNKQEFSIIDCNILSDIFSVKKGKKRKTNTRLRII